MAEMHRQQDQAADAMPQLDGAEHMGEYHCCLCAYDKPEAAMYSPCPQCRQQFCLHCMHTQAVRITNIRWDDELPLAHDGLRVQRGYFPCPACRFAIKSQDVNEQWFVYTMHTQHAGARPAADADIPPPPPQPGMGRRALNALGNAMSLAVDRATQGDQPVGDQPVGDQPVGDAAAAAPAAAPAADPDPPQQLNPMQVAIDAERARRQARNQRRAARAEARAEAEARAAAGAEAPAAAGAEAPAVPQLHGMQEAMNRELGNRRRAVELNDVDENNFTSDDEAAPGQQAGAPVEQPGAPVEQVLQPIIGNGQCRLCLRWVQDGNRQHLRTCVWNRNNRLDPEAETVSWH